MLATRRAPALGSRASASTTPRRLAAAPDAVVERMAATGAGRAFLGPADLGAPVRREVPRGATVIGAGGVTLN